MPQLYGNQFAQEHSKYFFIVAVYPVLSAPRVVQEGWRVLRTSPWPPLSFQERLPHSVTLTSFVFNLAVYQLFVFKEVLAYYQNFGSFLHILKKEFIQTLFKGQVSTSNLEMQGLLKQGQEPLVVPFFHSEIELIFWLNTFI